MDPQLVQDVDSSTGLMLRCSLGELAVMAGARSVLLCIALHCLKTGLTDDWVRPYLVKTLQDFERLEPKDPSGQAVAAWASCEAV